MEQLDKVLKSYPEELGKGMDNINPRSWLYLPRPAKVKLIELMHSFELRPVAFEELLTLMCFIQKATGGVRPIALTVAFLRVWSRLRSKVARELEASCEDPFFWGGEGRSCESAAYLHNIVARWAQQRNLDIASLALDLQKF